MEHKCLISIIVPVYNVESYLERCVNSIINQTYHNLEIILVDDGSPDGSGDLCDKLAKNDDRITVYHKKNGGLSDARNYGVQNANGEYITFIDSDDFVAKDYIEHLYSMIQEFNADIAAALYYRTSGDEFTGSMNKALPKISVLDGKEACYKLLQGEEYYGPLVIACAKLIRSNIVKENPFPVGKKHEDEATSAKFLTNANKVALSNREIYAYYQNENSITHTKGSIKNEDAIWSIHHRAEYLESLGEYTLSQKAYEFLFDYLARDSVFNHRRCDSDIERLLKGKKLTLRWEIYKALHKVSLRLYRTVRRF